VSKLAAILVVALGALAMLAALALGLKL